MSESQPTSRPEVERSLVELVIVHGMGRQKPSETLLEWAEALLRRIDWIATGGDSENDGVASGIVSSVASAQALDAARAIVLRERSDGLDAALQEESARSAGGASDLATDADVLSELRQVMHREDLDSLEFSELVFTLLDDDLTDALEAAETAEVFETVPALGPTAAPPIAVAPAPVPAAAAPPAAVRPRPTRRRRGGGALTDDPEPRPTAIEYGEVVLSEDGPDAVNATIGFADPGGRLHTMSLRITEALWSEAVPPLTRGQVFAWGLRFVWRAILRAATHFGHVWWTPARSSRNLLRRALAGLGWVLMWAISLIAGAVLSVFLVLAGPLLVFPFVKKLAQSAIDALVDFVGDAAVWGIHPVRAAGMRDLVRSRIRSARDNLELSRKQMSGEIPTSLVVLAHSQGAAICADALFSLTNGEERIPVDAFVSVGAAVTLLGTSSWTLDRQSTATTRGSSGQEQPRNRVKAWARSQSRAGLKPTRWLNFWGIWDPIPAGPISTGKRSRTLRWQESYAERGLLPTGSAQPGPEENPVHNTASPLTDHQSYASNIPQVIDPVARMLMRLPEEQGDTHRHRVELHVRSIKSLGLNRLLILGGLALGFAVNFRGETTDASAGQQGAGLLDGARRVLALLFNGDPDKGFIAWLFGLGWLPQALVIVPLAIAALVLNGSLSRGYHRRLDWSRPDEKLPEVWASGAALRIMFAAIIAVELVLIVAAGPPDPSALGWGAAGLALSFVLLVLCVFAPRWGHLPSRVTQNPPSERPLGSPHP